MNERARRLLLLTGALVLGALSPPAGGQDPGRFAWPLPVELVVEERSEKDGKVVVQRHQLRAWRAGPDDVRAHVHASALVEVFGVAVTPADAQRPELAQLTFPFPVWRLGPDGTVRETLDLAPTMERWVERLLAVAPEDRRAPLEQLKGRVTSPGWLATYEDRLRDFWDAWVGAWAPATDLRVGERRELRRRTPHFDRAVEVVETLERLSPPGDAPPHGARFRRTSVIDGEAARAGYEAMLSQLAPPGQRIDVRAYRLETTLEVETDPTTLLPVRASLERRERTQVSDRPPREVHERRVWTFAREGAR
ncbi:MAG: hypothetical protein M9894_37190 [Planctomycetes bacterium]|nr:hypothetical protein [Planctomycetota bacterium]